VLTRDRNWSAEGAEIARSVDEALELARGERVSVIGGADKLAPVVDGVLAEQVKRYGAALAR
jgi:dihydrofolate reductase